jgi:hypothetical protein
MVVYHQLHTRTREKSLNAAGLSVIREGVQETNVPYNIISSLQEASKVSGTGAIEHQKLFGCP